MIYWDSVPGDRQRWCEDESHTDNNMLASKVAVIT